MYHRQEGGGIQEKKIENSVGWCGRNHQQLNIRKTKELVDTYWSDNTEALDRKGQSRLFFLRRLRSFSVCSRPLRMFCQSMVASVIFFAAVCWGGGIGIGGAIKLNKLLRKASSGEETGQCGGGEREEDERKAESYNGQSLSPSLRQAEATQTHVQQQTHPTTCLKALSPLIKDSTIHFSVTQGVTDPRNPVHCTVLLFNISVTCTFAQSHFTFIIYCTGHVHTRTVTVYSMLIFLLIVILFLTSNLVLSFKAGYLKTNGHNQYSRTRDIAFLKTHLPCSKPEALQCNLTTE